MAGYVTQKRNRAKPLVSSVRLLSSATPDESRIINVPDLQETYSFRSGVNGPSEDMSLVDDAKIFRSSRSYYGPYDTGHPFYTTRRRLTDMNFQNGRFMIDGYRAGYVDREVKGPLILTLAKANIEDVLPSIAPTPQSEVDRMGSIAIDACRPLKPESGLAQMLGELKADGLPAAPGESLLNREVSPRVLAGEYLNTEFGIIPLLSDIVKLRNAVAKSAAIVRQLKRDSGRIVRRRFSFPPSVTTTTTTYQVPRSVALYGYISDYCSSGSFTSQTVTDVTTRRVWFTGAFSYFLDPGKDLVGRFKRYEQLNNQLYGTRLTAATVWELAPWSWLVDWFSDVGKVLSNASALQDDDLVIKYGYLMVHTRTQRTVTSSGGFYGSPGPFSVTNSYVCERKERFRATPYGFGLDVESLSPRRMAILGALGFLPEYGKKARG
jgi:hypothetical protein